MSCSSESISPGLSPHGSSASSPEHSPNKQPSGRRNLMDSGVLDVDMIDAVPFPFPPRRNVFIEPGSGMRDVPMWLKGLRLHKYTSLFQQLSYDQMMQLTEQQLDMQGVTKGARHKIVTCVVKLRERTDLLRQLENDLVEPGGVRTTLAELRSMAYTPIRPFPPPGKPVCDQALIDGVDVDPKTLDPENLPAHFTRILGQVCQTMFGGWTPGTDVDLECATTLMHIIDRIINHEAFTQAQKRRVISWKQNIKRVWNPPATHFGSSKYNNRTNGGPQWCRERRCSSTKWGPGEYRGWYRDNKQPQGQNQINPQDAAQLMMQNMSLSMYQQLMVSLMAQSNWAAAAYAQQMNNNTKNISHNIEQSPSTSTSTNHTPLLRTGSMPAPRSSNNTSFDATYGQYITNEKDTDHFADSHNLLEPLHSDSLLAMYTTPQKQAPGGRNMHRSPWSPASNCTGLLSTATTPLTVNTDYSNRYDSTSPKSFSLFNTPSSGSSNELNLKMDQLCRSMAEQVINGSIDSPSNMPRL